MHVHVKVADQGWILERMGRELAARLDNVTVDLDSNKFADIQYYINYSARAQRVSAIEFAYFTHLERDETAAGRFFDVGNAVDFCVCQSNPARNILLSRSISNLTVIPPGVDLDRFQPVVRIGVIGRTYHSGRKGEHLVAQVMDIPGIEWSFTGTGWPGPALEVSDQDLPAFYRSLDYVLVPSLEEGGPMCVIEALACGVPVIAPPVGWIPELPHIPYRTGDFADLRRVLCSLVKQKQDLHESVEAYSWENFADKHRTLFDSYRQHFSSGHKRVWQVNHEPETGHRLVAPRMNATLVMHGAERNTKGGPSLRVPNTAEGLRLLGVEARAKFFPDADLQSSDIVHVFNVWPPQTALAAITAARRLRKPTVFSPIYLDLSARQLWHNEVVAAFRSASGEGPLLQTLSRIKEQIEVTRRQDPFDILEPIPGYFSRVSELVSNADQLVFLSEAEQRRLATLIGAPVAGTIIRNPVARPTYDDPELFRQKYGLSDYVLCVGRIETRKNQLMLAYALRNSGIPLVLIGHCNDKSYMDEIKRLKASNLHIIDRLPPGSDLLCSAFAGARVFVLPSWAEGAPLAALEAASFGAPLVLSGSSGEREYFGEFARYCDPIDPSDICRQVLAAYEERTDEEARRKRRSHFETEFSYERYSQATLSVYREVLERSSHQAAVQSTAAARFEVESSARAAKTRVFIDLTTSAHSRNRMTGITRVEQKLAQFLPSSAELDVSFCCWHPGENRFLEVTQGETAPEQVAKLVQAKGRIPAPDLHPPFDGDFFVAGSAWMQNSSYASAVVDFCRNSGTRLNFVVCDLIPIKFPFWFAPGYTEVFERNLRLLVEQSDRLVAISQATKDDLVSYCRKVLGTTPYVAVIGLGDDFAEGTVSSSSTEAEEKVSHAVAALNLPQRFVLCVGAIHPRKNYHLLYSSWLRLRQEMGSKAPHLVIVGGMSWGGEWLLRAFEGDERLQGCIRVLEGVDDLMLNELYQRCLLTAYPSLYEGWGLPVAESLRRGKICLASDISSIREIVGHSPDLLDPLDHRAWAARIAMYSSSKIARENREAEIRSSYQTRSWQDTTTQIAECLRKSVADRVPSLHTGEIVAADRVKSLLTRRAPDPAGEQRSVSIKMRFRPIVRRGRDLELIMALRRPDGAPSHWELSINERKILDWVEPGTETRVVVAPIPVTSLGTPDFFDIRLAPKLQATERIDLLPGSKLDLLGLVLLEVAERSHEDVDEALSRRANTMKLLAALDQPAKKSQDVSKEVINLPQAPKKPRTLKKTIKRFIKRTMLGNRR